MTQTSDASQHTQRPMPDASFQHLQLEMSRLDILLHRQIQRQGRQAAVGEGDGAVLNLYHLSETQAYALLQRPFGAGDYALDEAIEGHYTDALPQVERDIATLVNRAEAAGKPLRLVALARLMGLDRFALDVFLICLAPLLDTRYAKIYGFLQDDLTRKRPSPQLILDLLAGPGPERLALLSHFADDAPLLRHHLLERLPEAGGERPFPINQQLAPDDGLASWLLLGQYRPHALLKTCLTYQPAPQPDPTLLPPGMVEKLANGVGQDGVWVFHGTDILVQQQAAALLAQSLGQPLLTLNLDTAAQVGQPAADALRLLLRDAQLTGALPTITGWDSCLLEDAPPPALLTMLFNYPGLLIIAGEKLWRPRDVARQRRLRWLAFPTPDTPQRERLLTHFLTEKTAGAEPDKAAVDNSTLTALAGQFILTTAQLRDVVSSAHDLAGQNGRAIIPPDLFAAARAHSNPRLESLARKITPRYTWDDLILPDDQIQFLREMVDTVRSRPLVLQTWGVGKKLASSAGVTSLFYGPPGTGKTLAAQILAGELGLDLYKIDLSSMVSKYIGETEKNLERIFSEAESSNAILFFDEADAIFGKRSEVRDAHDRYANIEISYLLQRMEAYDGVTILATNLRANLDEAFMRRLQFGIDFPFPRTADRLRIWQALFPPETPRAPDLDLEFMAERFEIAGGNIRNIIVTATFLAANNGQMVTMAHLLHGARREMQKMGRLVNERDLQR
ncbi:MAG: ATP-binding protein [Anaerolinea sp.]|nr:ATP-binding protein [Anaerolinea sp.]